MEYLRSFVENIKSCMMEVKEKANLTLVQPLLDYAGTSRDHHYQYEKDELE